MSRLRSGVKPIAATDYGNDRTSPETRSIEDTSSAPGRSVAIATTKIPMLLDKGLWAAAHEARTDLSMLLGLVFLLIEGAGSLSIDRRLGRGLDGRNT
jgi:uncharacterized membrane protein